MTSAPALVLRARILADHRALRALTRRARARCDEIEIDETALVRARVDIAELLEAVSNHAELEERELPAVLLTLDAWGPVRIAAYREDHLRHMAEVDRLQRMLGDGVGGGLLASELRGFVAEIERDMDDEEAGPLAVDVLGAARP
jgi:hypothetical protein